MPKQELTLREVCVVPKTGMRTEPDPRCTGVISAAHAIAKLADPWSTNRYESGPTLAGFAHSA
jgi:hypothetical protein